MEGGRRQGDGQVVILAQPPATPPLHRVTTDTHLHVCHLYMICNIATQSYKTTSTPYSIILEFLPADDSQLEMRQFRENLG